MPYIRSMGKGGVSALPSANQSRASSTKKGIHFVRQTREMDKELFLSLPEKTKIDMLGRQFYISRTAYPKIQKWIFNRAQHPYRIERELDKFTNKFKYWVLFYSKEDAVLFKMECESELGIEDEDED